MKFTRAQAVALCHVSLQYSAEVELEIVDTTPDRHAVAVKSVGQKDIWYIGTNGTSEKQARRTPDEAPDLDADEALSGVV